MSALHGVFVHLRHGPAWPINQSIILGGGLSNKQLPQGPRKEKS